MVDRPRRRFQVTPEQHAPVGVGRRAPESCSGEQPIDRAQLVVRRVRRGGDPEDPCRRQRVVARLRDHLEPAPLRDRLGRGDRVCAGRHGVRLVEVVLREVVESAVERRDAGRHLAAHRAGRRRALEGPQAHGARRARDRVLRVEVDAHEVVAHVEPADVVQRCGLIGVRVLVAADAPAGEALDGAGLQAGRPRNAGVPVGGPERREPDIIRHRWAPSIAPSSSIRTPCSPQARTW